MGPQNTKLCSIPFLGFKLLSIRRECERAWSALGTEDRMRKKERNTVRQAGGRASMGVFGDSRDARI